MLRQTVKNVNDGMEIYNYSKNSFIYCLPPPDDECEYMMIEYSYHTPVLEVVMGKFIRLIYGQAKVLAYVGLLREPCHPINVRMPLIEPSLVYYIAAGST
jgi:hypothetical protein